MTLEAELVHSVHVDTLVPVEVGPGIQQWTLPTTDRARGWLIDFAPGSEWPVVDVHEDEERYFVLDGEIVEGDRRYAAGSYLVFAPGSSHRPRSDSGGRMLGINISGPAGS